MWDFDEFADDCFDFWNTMEELNINRDVDWDDDHHRWLVRTVETGNAF